MELSGILLSSESSIEIDYPCKNTRQANTPNASKSSNSPNVNTSSNSTPIPSSSPQTVAASANQGPASEARSPAGCLSVAIAPPPTRTTAPIIPVCLPIRVTHPPVLVQHPPLPPPRLQSNATTLQTTVPVSTNSPHYLPEMVQDMKLLSSESLSRESFRPSVSDRVSIIKIRCSQLFKIVFDHF